MASNFYVNRRNVMQTRMITLSIYKPPSLVSPGKSSSDLVPHLHGRTPSNRAEKVRMHNGGEAHA
jgi:hypothetical protein